MNTMTYLVDFMVCSETIQEYYALLKLVAERLVFTNLTINIEKSRFMLRECKFFVVIVGES